MTRLIRRGLTGLCLVLAPALSGVCAAQDTVTYVHTDAIGSVRVLTNATGLVLQQHDYLPFGEEPAPPTSVPNSRRFGAKERDTATGYDYFGARYMSSQTGRFTTVDPLLNMERALPDPQRWNRYQYAANNPLKFTDPDGRDPLVIGGAIGAGVYSLWNTYVNVQQGRPWYQNIGLEASKGFLVGVTLGLAAPALVTATAVDAGAVTAASVGGSAVDRALRSADAAIRFEGQTAKFLSERNLLKSFDVTIAGRQIDAIAGTTRSVVIEMTTGLGGGKLAQAAAQAKATGMEVIIYGPRITAGFVREAARQGFRVARSQAELERMLRE